jgi:uncharacterized cupredoxin-like copper-binding protein
MYSLCPMPRPLKPLAAMSAVLLAVTACSSGGSGGVDVTLDEFSVRAQPAAVQAGETSFEIRNTGSVEHDFLVLDTDLEPDDVPLEKGKVDTKARGMKELGHVHSVRSGQKTTEEIDLEAGRFLLICNIEGHFQSGMHTPFQVR